MVFLCKNSCFYGQFGKVSVMGTPTAHLFIVLLRCFCVRIRAYVDSLVRGQLSQTPNCPLFSYGVLSLCRNSCNCGQFGKVSISGMPTTQMSKFSKKLLNFAKKCSFLGTPLPRGEMPILIPNFTPHTGVKKVVYV